MLIFCEEQQQFSHRQFLICFKIIVSIFPAADVIGLEVNFSRTFLSDIRLHC